MLIRWQGRKMAIPPSQLKASGVDESTRQPIDEWHYWVAQGHCFSSTHACRNLTKY